jgi:hypothetical protein
VSYVWISLSTTWQAVIGCRDCKYPSPLDHILFQGSCRPSEAELKLPCLLLQFPGTELSQFLHRFGHEVCGCSMVGFFHVLQLLSIIFTQYNWCCISKSIMKHVQKSDLKHDFPCFRATSHTRLRARDHYTLSTLISGKDRVGPSSLNKSRLRDQRSM